MTDKSYGSCRAALQTKTRITGGFQPWVMGAGQVRVKVWGDQPAYPTASNSNHKNMYILQAVSYSQLPSFLPQPREVDGKRISPPEREKIVTQLPSDED